MTVSGEEVPPQHQVFINYRGDELRKSFLGFVVKAMREAKINVFTDEVEVKGRDLQNLFRRIEESRVAVVILSERYTESSWCLDELVKMKEQMDQDKLVVIPIFYRLGATNCKRLVGTFGDNFRNLEREYRSEPERIKKWKEALISIPQKVGLTLAGHRPGSVWVQWFKEVILKGSVHNFWTTKPKQSFSWFVNKLLKLKDTIFPLVKLRIQNGESALFWFDNWTPFGSLSDHLSNSPSRLGIPPHATVSSLFRNGSWHLPPARTETQVQLQAYLMTITLTEDQDYYEWEINGQVSERFKTGELYAYLCAERADVQWSKAVWFSGGIPRHNFHTWLSVLDRIPTRDRLISWGINVDANCLLCNSMPESRNHLFFSCSFSFQLWSKVASKLEIQPQRGWEDTLNQMTALHLQKSHRLLVLTAWQATAYWLW
ncbi:unnamed protein product, partial [Brassica oleracea]